MIAIRKVVTRADLRAFVDVPYRNYRGDPHWVPPLRFVERRRLDRRHPFFAHADVDLFLAVDDGRVCGRIAAIDDALHNRTHADNLASFGLFEAESAVAARALLGAAEVWARARGRARMRGPLSLSLNDMAGLLVEGFDGPPAILMPFNPPAYAGYLTDAGYVKAKDLYAWALDLARPLDPAIVLLADRVRDRYQVRIGSATAATIMREIPDFLEIYAQAWAGNWGFVPPTPEEALRFAADLKQIADPSLVLYAEVAGVRAACAVAVPDMNQLLEGTSGRVGPRLIFRFLTRRRRITRARLLLLGVRPEYRRIGLFPLLAAELARRGEGRFKEAEFSWVLEDNDDINHAAARVGARRYRTYRLFEKALDV